MEETLLSIKEECLIVLRNMHCPEIDRLSVENDRGRGIPVQIGNGTVGAVYRVRAIEPTTLGKGRRPLHLKKDIGVELAVVKAPHAHRISTYMSSFATRKLSREHKMKKVLGYYRRECAIWARISAGSNTARDNNLLEFYGFLESYDINPLPAFVAKLYPLGDVRNYMFECFEPRLSTKHKLHLISDVAKALAFLHSVCGIAHRDVRGSNVLLEAQAERLVGVLGDFGSAKEFMVETQCLMLSSSESGNECWSPPEYHREGGFHNDKGSGDIWSLGCTMLELLQEANPWYQIPAGEIPTRIAAYEYPPKGEKVLDSHYKFMEKCWTEEDQRPSASELHSQISHLAETCDS